MVEPKAITDEGKRLADLFAEVNAMLLDHPEVLEQMPEDFVLVTLPEGAPELASYALSLVPKHPGKPVVYALVHKDKVTFLLPQGPIQATLEAA